MNGAGRGRFLTLEGVDGAGKSTLVGAIEPDLRARLGRQGHTLVRTREPGGTPLAEALRADVLARPMHPLTETLLMFAARNEHVREVIEPALARGDWVLCDRFTDASHAYQSGARGVDTSTIDTLARWVHPRLVPDLTVLLDVPPAIAAERRARARAADRFESESEGFFAAVRAAYLDRARADPGRFLVLSGELSPGTAGRAVLERIAPWLN